jgi:hypothetical protein
MVEEGLTELAQSTQVWVAQEPRGLLQHNDPKGLNVDLIGCDRSVGKMSLKMATKKLIRQAGWEKEELQQEGGQVEPEVQVELAELVYLEQAFLKLFLIQLSGFFLVL